MSNTDGLPATSIQHSRLNAEIVFYISFLYVFIDTKATYTRLSG